MEAERREKGLLNTSNRASAFLLARFSSVCPRIYPTSTRARVAAAAGRVECLCRLGRRWGGADLDVAATGAAHQVLPLHVATCRAGRVQRRATHGRVCEKEIIVVVGTNVALTLQSTKTQRCARELRGTFRHKLLSWKVRRHASSTSWHPTPGKARLRLLQRKSFWS